MKRIIEIPDKIVEAIQNGEDYRYDIHTAIAQSIPCDDSGDLISRKDLQAKHDESCAGDCACCTYGVDYTKSSDSKFHCLLIDNAPTVPNRPQGEWKTTVHGLRAYNVCSKCNTEYPFDLTQDWILCPVCGADMRKGGAE